MEDYNRVDSLKERSLAEEGTFESIPEKDFRNEFKFLVSIATANTLKNRLAGFMARDPHARKFGNGPVLSLYYDSPDLAFYREKIDGNPIRSKVRVRTYANRFCTGLPIFAEVKHRFRSQIKKIRGKTKLSSLDFLNDSTLWNFSDERANRFFYELSTRYRLRPVAQVWYTREAYCLESLDDLRITFDHNILGTRPFVDNHFDLLHSEDNKLISDSQCVLEIKSCGVLPDWVFRLIVDYQLEQISFSKYCNAIDILYREGV